MHPLNFEVVPVVHEKYLSVTTEVEYTLENLFLFVNQIKSEADACKRKRVLIDWRNFSGYMSEAERFLAGKHVAETFGSRIRAAVLMPAEQITKLGEITAVNRGAQLLVTANEEEAMTYLLA